MGLHARLNRITQFLAKAEAALIGRWSKRERDAHERSLVEALLRAWESSRHPSHEPSPRTQAILAAADAAEPTPGWAGPKIDPARLDAAVRESVRQRGSRPFVPVDVRDVLRSPEYQARVAARSATKEGA